MKLVIIRHGDPDYSIDSVTPKGKIEVEYLAERVAKMDIKEMYVSPKGRAQATAAPSLKLMGRTAETLDWLTEFEYKFVKPYMLTEDVPWDWLPQVMVTEPMFYDKDNWYNAPAFAGTGVKEAYLDVIAKFDAFLADHGYVRNGLLYDAVKPNNDTIVFFCHFGLECVLLSHLLNVSPMVLWHGFCAAPSSVTTVVTEERREGIACFRTIGFGDTSHLYVHDEPNAFHARFCECYDNYPEERRDPDNYKENPEYFR